eukprot:Clim_evm8s17 gene=Clim_evmTU8s17
MESKTLPKLSSQSSGSAKSSKVSCVKTSAKESVPAADGADDDCRDNTDGPVIKRQGLTDAYRLSLFTVTVDDIYLIAEELPDPESEWDRIYESLSFSL